MAQEVHGLLVANTKATLTVTAAADRLRGGRTQDVEIEKVIVTNLAAEPLYLTTDGTDPTVRGDDTKMVAPGGYREISVTWTESQQVEAICAAAGSWSLEAVSGET